MFLNHFLAGEFCGRCNEFIYDLSDLICKRFVLNSSFGPEISFGNDPCTRRRRYEHARNYGFFYDFQARKSGMDQ